MEKIIKPSPEFVYDSLKGLDEMLKGKELTITLFGSGAVGIYCSLKNYIKSRFDKGNYDSLKGSEFGIKELVDYLKKDKDNSKKIYDLLRDTKDLDFIVQEDEIFKLSKNLNLPINVAFLENEKYIQQVLAPINGVELKFFQDSN
ncbi:MAG: hypothetical protein WC376_04155 [Candidatus Nanoarchaeia archaeon]|jgi:hypothetical protein